MKAFTSQIVELIESALKTLDAAEVLSEISVDQLLEVPPDEKMGDYAFPCFALARHLRRSPTKIAEDIGNSIEKPNWLHSINVVGAYVNFVIDPSHLADNVLRQVQTLGDQYGSAKARGETVVIDYSSPNIAKPFTLGHIRSTVIGESLARLFASQGYKVVRINHLGDWGTQFGRLISAFLRWGSEEQLQDEPIKELFRLYVRFHEEVERDEALEEEARSWFKRLEEGDAKATELWQRFRDLSIEEFERMYKRLDIQFDDYTGESGYNDHLASTVERLRAANMLTESDGALVVELGDNIPPCLIMKSDGATLYATRDISAAFHRYEKYGFRYALYVVDSRQSLHFQQVFSVLERLDCEWADSMEHIAFGTLQFGDEIMSTRKGNVIFLEDVLNESVRRVTSIIEERNPELENKEEVAEHVGVGAVVFNDLVHNRVKDVVFEWDSVLSFEGDTGPYVQYTHARACSVLRRAKEAGYTPLADGFTDREWHDGELTIVRLLGRFVETVAQAMQAREPSTVARYILDLAKAFNAFYHQNRILNSGREQERLAITDAVRQVLANGLYLLSIRAPEKM